MASEKIIELNTENFQDEITKGPILVDFWAEWCGPCRMVAPVLSELADELEGQVRIAKVNVDNNQDLAVQFGVQSIPTFVLFEDGQMKDRMMGAMPKSAFQNFLAKNVELAVAS